MRINVVTTIDVPDDYTEEQTKEEFKKVLKENLDGDLEDFSFIDCLDGLEIDWEDDLYVD